LVGVAKSKKEPHELDMTKVTYIGGWWRNFPQILTLRHKVVISVFLGGITNKRSNTYTTAYQNIYSAFYTLSLFPFVYSGVYFFCVIGAYVFYW
jgi:hypothetical protein